MSTHKLTSNIVLFLFFILVAAAAGFSHLFQNPIKNGKQFIEQTKLFSSNNLALITKITLKNKSGEFVFERDESHPSKPWHMISPRDISGNSIFIDKLFNSLTIIKVKQLYPDEKINISNFSIDKPTSVLTLMDKEEKNTIINFGLVNSIDNSTYLKLNGKPGIYHVEAPTVALEDATLLDLIESQIFTQNLYAIESFKVFKGSNKSTPPTLEFFRKGKDWVDNLGIPLSSPKLDEYFQDLFSIKSSFILDKPSETQKKQISTYLQKPEFILSIIDNKNSSIDYSISSVVRSLGEIDLKNEEYFIVSVSNNSTTFIVKKEFLELFTRKTEFFKSTTLPATNDKK